MATRSYGVGSARVAIGLGALFFNLSACSSFIESATDRGIMSDRLNSPGKDPNRLKSMIGDRRILRVVKLQTIGDPVVPDQQRFLVCPEPFSGAIIARGAKSGITVTKVGGATDEVDATALAVDQRGEVVRLYEDASAWYCFLRASGDLDRAHYVDALEHITELAFDKLTPPKAAAVPAEGGADPGKGDAAPPKGGPTPPKGGKATPLKRSRTQHSKTKRQVK